MCIRTYLQVSLYLRLLIKLDTETIPVLVFIRHIIAQKNPSEIASEGQHQEKAYKAISDCFVRMQSRRLRIDDAVTHGVVFCSLHLFSFPHISYHLCLATVQFKPTFTHVANKNRELKSGYRQNTEQTSILSNLKLGWCGYRDLKIYATAGKYGVRENNTSQRELCVTAM